MQPIKKITIEIAYDDRFRRQVEEGTASPLTTLTVRADGQFVVGSESTNAGDWMSRHLREELLAIPDIVSGERTIVEFGNGPTWLVFEPHEDDTLVYITHVVTRFSATENPDQRLPVDTTVLVTKRAWIRELVRTSEEYVKNLTEINPDLTDETAVVKLREAIRQTERESPRLFGDD
jgi:hypothetical protein